MSRTEIRSRIRQVNYELIEASGQNYRELKKELEDLQIELDMLEFSTGSNVLYEEELNFNPDEDIVDLDYL